jgi:tetrahydromethanopterin S-methyltransferase subunit G
MIDYFALLDIERRPAITEESLKQSYFRKTESLRLDQAEAEVLSSLNMAFRIIANPARRIQHLLKLEFGDARGGQIGSDLGELFGSVVGTLQQADDEFGSLSTEGSALLRAVAFQRMEEVREKLDQIGNELLQRENGLLSQLGQLDSLWTESPAQCRELLAQIALRLTFVQKWLSEVRERKIRLEELA